VKAELFHAVRPTDSLTASQTEGQTDMMKLIIAFLSIANVTKNGVHCAVWSELKERLASFSNFVV